MSVKNTRLRFSHIRLRAEVGDNEAMQDWLALENVYRTSSHEKTFKKLDVSKLVEFVDANPSVQDFDLYEFLKNYYEFK